MAYSFFSSSSLLDILWIALSIVFRYKAGKEQVGVSETLTLSKSFRYCKILQDLDFDTVRSFGQKPVIIYYGYN